MYSGLDVPPEYFRGETNVSSITFPKGSVTCQQTNIWGHPSYQHFSPTLVVD